MKTERRTVQVPRWFRPRLSAEQRRDLAIVQLWNVADVDRGVATRDTLLDLARDAFTWSKAAELLDAGTLEMRMHLEVITQLIEHFGRTDRAEFSSRAQATAVRLGVAYMEDLAQLADRDTMLLAARFSEQMVDQLQARREAA